MSISGLKQVTFRDTNTTEHWLYDSNITYSVLRLEDVVGTRWY